MITISHTHADGTLLEGSRKGDGVYELLKGLRDNWRYFPSIRAIGIGQSRDNLANTYKINRAAEALRAAGHDVTVTIDDGERRTFAEAEAERNERAEDRAGRMAGYAANAQARSTAAYERAHQMADAIPFGQPMMPDHYSYGRDKRYRERITSTFERSFAEADKAEHYAHRAENAETYREARESVPVTLRRIAKLEADARRYARELEGRLTQVQDEAGAWKWQIVKPGPRRTAQLEQLAAGAAEQIGYWRGIVAEQEASGVKVWGKADFTKGDFALFLGTWYEVLRVNAQSVTIPGMIGARGDVCTRASCTVTWTDTVPYHKVKGRKSAAEIAELDQAAS